MSKVILKTSDGFVTEVDRKVAMQSVLIRNLLEDVDGEKQEYADGPTLAIADEPIPLNNITGSILQKVIQYATHHIDDEISTDKDDVPDSAENIDPWDREFINVDQGTLFELILAANYLDIKGLLDLGCKTVANMIKNKSVDSIRKMLNIKNDFTPEEQEVLKTENSWSCDI